MICTATCVPTSSWASVVEPATWGVAMKFESPMSGEFFGGSSANTSTAAPASCPLFNAAARAASSINSPRAALITRAPFFIFEMVEELIRFCVAGLSAVCNETKSLCASKISSGTSSTDTSRAAASLMKGSYASTRMSKASARTATSLPILPRPIRPSVFPRTSVPAAVDFSQRPS